MHCTILCCVELCFAMLYCIILRCKAYNARESKSLQFLRIEDMRKGCVIGFVWEIQASGNGLLVMLKI